MPRKLETAQISFGLVTVQVGIYSAIDEQDIHFNQLHAACGSRIKQERVCPVCKREVTYDELVKGYEVAKGEYVRLQQDELDQLRATASEAMTIIEFVPLATVDPIYYESTYYLGPEGRVDKAYHLFAQAMEAMQRVALAKYVWRGKESVFLIRPAQGKLLLHRMYYHDEIREFEVTAKDKSATAAELKLATQLIDSISSETFAAAEYHDEYRGRVLELIEQKRQGKTLTRPPKSAPPVTEVIDLMQRLKESIATTQKKRPLRSRALPAGQTVQQTNKRAHTGKR